MAWLVLLSTITFTLEKHFCGDVLIDTAIFSKAESCCNLEVLAMAEKKSCCKEEVEVIRGQDSLKKAIFEDLHNDQQIVLVTFYYSYYNLFEGLPVQFIPHKNYSPPLLVTDIQILDQVFII
ncbi:hypothetical protein H3Z82_11140 [Gelidibacter gilvus]|uniref:Uncharacterized protein n=1 Tax=Gelidibacter maritimus TaxID=2761487 RepID=A0A7W2R3W4_9FLAO|nr:hypothetical protein [Gelidibacter maritimus]